MRRCLLFALLAVFAVAAGPAAAAEGPLLGSWAPVTTTGTYTPRIRAASAAANGRLIICGGIDAVGNVVDVVEGMKFTTGAWQTYAPMPTARRDAVAVTVNEKIYVIGGYDPLANEGAGGPVDTVEMLDPVTNTWTTLSPMLTARAGVVAVACTVGTNQEIHVYGSDPAGTFPSNIQHEIYDVATDIWRSAPYTAPGVSEGCGTAAKDLVTGETFLYMFGGFSGGAGATSSAWRVNPASGSGWDNTVHEMPDSKILAAAMTLTAAHPDGGSAEYPIIIGGNVDRSGTLTDRILVYESGELNGWVSSPNVAPALPAPRGERPAVCAYAGYVYVAGGAEAAGPSTTVYRAQINASNYPSPPPPDNPVLVGWESVNAPIPTPRWYTTHAVVDGKLYVIGGWATSDGIDPAVGTNEMYDPATNTWTTKAPMPVPVRGAVAAAIDGKIYVAGGSKANLGANDYESALQIYDPIADAWTQGTPMPTPRTLVTGFAASGLLHVMGGTKDDPANPGTPINTGEHEVYDPATDTWSGLNPPGCPWPMADAACTVASISGMDMVYFLGGWWGMSQLSLSARWNCIPGGAFNDQWYQIASLPVGGNSGLTAATIADAAGNQWPMVFGGHFGPVGYFDKVFKYHDFSDPVFPNQWVRDSSMVYPRGGRMAVAQIGDYVYITAGMGPLGLAADTFRSAIGSSLPADAATIGEAIAQPNGKKVNIIEAKVITRTYWSMDYGNYFWIEEADRSAALRVGPTYEMVNPGNKVLVSGTMAADSATGERTLLPSSLTIDTAVYPIPEPIGITNRSFIGGAKGGQPGRPDGVGLNNMGVLARIWGKVTAGTLDPGYDGNYYLYIDDGSGLSDGTDTGGVPNAGIRVYHMFYVDPLPGQYVSATGIISCEKVNGQLVPMLLSDEITIGDGTSIVVY